MTMGFRNRPRPSTRTYDGSPTAGRVIVATICLATIISGVAAFSPHTLLIPFAVCGIFVAVFKPDAFE